MSAVGRFYNMCVSIQLISLTSREHGLSAGGEMAEYCFHSINFPNE
jgi:hypothetical protein